MISSRDYFSINVKAIWIQLRQEPYYFWCLCFYLIFEYVRPQAIYTSIDVIPYAKIFVLLAIIGSLLDKKTSKVPSPLTKYFWGLMLVVVLSATFAEFPEIAFANINTPLNWLIIYYIFIRIVTTKFRYFTVILLIMLATYKMSQHAAIAWVRRDFAFDRWGVSGGLGLFGNAADLGVQMLVILPLSVFLILRCYSYWGILKKIFFSLFPISILMAIIATGERNTLVGLVAICIVSALATKKRIRNLFVMSIFMMCIFAVMPEQFRDRFDTIGTDNTSQSRLRYWNRGIDFFIEHPILGIGYNNWVPYYQKYYPGESLRGEHQEVAHSTPITVLAELGILGAIFYYCIAFNTLTVNFRTMKIPCSDMQGFWDDIPFALNVGLVGFLVASLFLSITFYPFLFIQASLSAALYNIRLNENRSINHVISSIHCVKTN